MFVVAAASVGILMSPFNPIAVLAGSFGDTSVQDIINGFTGDDGEGKGSSKGEKEEAGGDDAGDVNRAILTNARKYIDLPYVYGGGHPPDKWLKAYESGKKGLGLDCSGLIDVAVAQATNGKVVQNEVAQGFQHNSHWKEVSFKDAKPGDIVFREKRPGEPDHHAGIVVKNDGKGKFWILEAASSHLPYDQQIRQKTFPYGHFDKALRFKG